MTREFPVYATPDEVRCFGCGSQRMSLATPSGYPSGRFVKTCRMCGMKTYFDINPNKEDNRENTEDEDVR